MNLVRKSVVLLVASGTLALSACGGDDEGETTAAEATAPETTTTAEEVPSLDTKGVESTLKKELDGMELIGVPIQVYPEGGGAPSQSELGGGRLDVSSVTCPPEVPLEKGGTFSCEIQAKKGGGMVEVTQLDAAGKQFKYSANIKSSAPGAPSSTKVSAKITVG